MKKKTVRISAIALALGLTLSGCVKTPDQTLVAQKNNERLEEAAKENPKAGTSLKEVAEVTTSCYDFNYSSEDGRVTILADHVPVSLPARDTIPMYHVSCGEIPQEVADRIYDFFFPGGAFAESGDAFTIGDVDEQIQEIQQEITAIQEDDRYSEEEKEGLLQGWEEILSNLQEERKNAPEESTLKLVPKDSSYEEHQWETSFGLETVMQLNVVSEDQKNRLVITSAGTSSAVISEVRYEDCHAWRYTMENEIAVPGFDCEEACDAAAQTIGISQEDARDIVNDFIEAIGMNWEIHDIFCAKGYKTMGSGMEAEEIASDGYTAYRFVLAQTMDGIQSAVTSQHDYPDVAAIPWLYEQISIWVEADGIVGMNWEYPLTVEDTVSDNVGIISFEAAKDIFENMMPLVAKGDLEKWEDEISETRAKITVSDVRLGLMRVRNSGSEFSGLMTPVWLFYGDYSRFIHYLPGAEDILPEAEDFSFSEDQPWILLAVNAVDGSVIDITEGY